MRYTEARELVEAALSEMAQTNARYRQMGDHIERATVAYHEGKRGAGSRLKSLIKRDDVESRSGILYGHGGRKIKNPKKHKDSRPLGEMFDSLDEDYTTPERDRENFKAINAAFAKGGNAEREFRRDDRERKSKSLIGKGGKKVKVRRGVAYNAINLAGKKEKLTGGLSLKPHKSNKDPNKGRLKRMAVAMGYPKRKKSGSIFNSDDLNLDKTPSAIFDRRGKGRK